MNMNRRNFIAGSAAAVSAAALPFGPAFASEDRGIIVILADDLFAVEHFRNTFGVRISTPNYDDFLRRSVRFHHTFATTALCNPSRTSIWTGLNPFKTGVHYNYDRWEDHVPAEKTVFAHLKKAGWNTYAYGKVFHSRDLSVLPVGAYINHTFSEQWANDKDVDPFNVPVQIQRMKFLPPGPFFMALGLTDPHHPLISAQQFRDLYPLDRIKIPSWDGTNPPNWVLPWLHQNVLRGKRKNGILDDYIRDYLANVSEMDFSLGRLLNNIKRWCPNAVVIFTSDHGYSLGDHDHIAKFTLWDQAGRVPFLVYDPLAAPITRGRAVHDVVSLIDLAPTILDYAGLPIPDEMDGVSLKPMAENPSLRRNWPAMTTMFGSMSMRTNGYRYTRYTDGGEELFIIADDPDNSHNVIHHARWQHIVQPLRDRFDTHLRAWMTTTPKCMARTSGYGGEAENICPPRP